MTLRRKATCWFVATLCVVTHSSAYAGGSLPLEYQVKLACLYSLSKYVEWPAEAFTDDNFHICILGENRFGDQLEALETKKARQRNVMVDVYQSPSPEMQKCHILFLGDAEEGALAKAQASLPPTLLTVGEQSQQAMINFVLIEEKVKIEIMQGRVEKSGLRVSSELMKLAIVRNE